MADFFHAKVTNNCFTCLALTQKQILRTRFFYSILLLSTTAAMAIVYLLLGGNKGDVPATFSKVLSLLKEEGVRILSAGPLYKSEPWGMETTDMFYNQPVAVDTSLSPRQLLNRLLSIERSLGRKRTAGVTGSRAIDIDILFYDDKIISFPDLEIPHPRLHLRKFALLPLMDIAPDLQHPLLKKSIRQLVAELDDPLKVEKVRDGAMP